MKAAFKSKHLAVGVVIVFCLIQLKTVERINPSYEVEKDMIEILNPPLDVEDILKQACYDCHSNQTDFPWYSKIAPASWMIERNVNLGREEVNFSNWASYRSSRAMHKLEESYKQVKHDHMPVLAYTWMHPQARLSDVEKNKLLNWLENKANEMMDEMN